MATRRANRGIARNTLIALLFGVILLGGSFFLDRPIGDEFTITCKPDAIIAKPENHALRGIFANVVREFGIILVSVFGISYLYEKLSKDEQFNQFYKDLQGLIRQGETNAARCEFLGILEIHPSRRSFEEHHSFATKVGELKSGDWVRIVGRSLIFTMLGWVHLKRILESGATLELCLCDPAMQETPLDYLAGYSQMETSLAVDRFIRRMLPWLKESKPLGKFEIRVHDIHLLDSFVEMKKGEEYRATWDLNFGEGLESRQVFFLDSERGMGKNLGRQRYDLLWREARSVFKYKDKVIELDDLSPK